MSGQRRNYGGHWIREKRRVGIYLRDGFACVYCGKTAKTADAVYYFNGPRGKPTRLGLDHVIPRSRGGSHSSKNVVTCCRRCNESKGDLPLAVWLLGRVERGELTQTDSAVVYRRVQRRLGSPLDTKTAQSLAEWLDESPANDDGDF